MQPCITHLKFFPFMYANMAGKVAPALQSAQEKASPSKSCSVKTRRLLFTFASAVTGCSHWCASIGIILRARVQLVLKIEYFLIQRR